MLHAAVLWGASRAMGPAIVHEPAAAPEEIVAHLDLRLVSGSDRGAERALHVLPDAQPIARDEMPNPANELVALDEVFPRDEAIEQDWALDASVAAPFAGARESVASVGAPSGSAGSTRLHARRASGAGTASGRARAAEVSRRGSSEGEITGNLTPPEVVSAPDPEYPEAARRRGQQGDVRCRLNVDANGCVVAVEVIGTSGSTALDDAARAALLTWRFRPATSGGVACACSIDHVVTFRLVAVHSRA